MKTTVKELVAMLNNRIAEHPSWETAEVEVDSMSITNYHFGEVIEMGDELHVEEYEDDDYPEFDDSVDESNYDPFMGMDWYE